MLDKFFGWLVSSMIAAILVPCVVTLVLVALAIAAKLVECFGLVGLLVAFVLVGAFARLTAFVHNNL